MEAERKAYNFYKSHWDQIKMLKKDQQHSLFMAISKVQFLEVNIEDISFSDQITNIVWTGIKHSISTSLNGFINKQKSLNKGVIIPLAKGSAQQEEEQEEGEEKEQEEEQLVISEIYNAYPTKCIIQTNRSLGKSKNNKDKIKSLLKSNTKDYLIKVIKWYIEDCRKSNTYMKNFGTFLNNLPDIGDDKPKAIAKPDEQLYRVMYVGGGTYHRHTQKEIDAWCHKWQTRVVQQNKVSQ